MEISHFELIYKPQSPSTPTGTAAVDRVIQGYFLEITNLEDKEYRYRLEFVISPPPVGTPNRLFRTLAGNALVFVDSGGTDNQQGILSGTLADERFLPSTGFVRVPPRGTALVAVLPSVFGPVQGDSTPIVNPIFEVRGYVNITLPAVRQKGPPFVYPFFTVPQSNTPVRVMLTPQNRTTYLTALGAISDQTQSSLPLASGSAINVLPPEPGGPLVFAPLRLDERLPSIFDLLEQRPELLQPELVAALIGQIDPGNFDLAEFDRALANVNVPLSLQVRQKKT
ncbi:MAG TPA: hypothetical protein VJ890_13845 [Vineibacter sp.]|nr:hypothetical protein [Vineibacter sp.]